MIHCKKCGVVPVPESDLPVLLPEGDIDFTPKGRSPLADSKEFMDVNCPECRGKARRDADTMDTFVCSSWYFLRYMDAHNPDEPFSKVKAKEWLPVDKYIGGIEHACGHLIYFRFFTKFLHDIGWLDHKEPARRLFNHGMVSNAEGDVMSKSKGNVVSPMDLIEERGVDVSRLAMFFAAPSDRPIAWDTDEYLTGPEKFVHSRLYTLVEVLRGVQPDLKYHFRVNDLTKSERSIYIKLNQTIKRVSQSFERLQFNTAISALMELVRDFEPDRIISDDLNDQVILKTIQMIAPLAPHLAEEMWELAGFSQSVFLSNWPEYDPDAVVGDTIEIAVQVNGKLRGTVVVPIGCEQALVEKVALEHPKIQAHIGSQKILKVIHVPGRLISFVVRG